MASASTLSTMARIYADMGRQGAEQAIRISDIRKRRDLDPNTAQRYRRRNEYLRNQRNSSWIAHWRELSEVLLPRHARFDPSDRWRAGSKKNQKIINNTGTRALRILAAGLMELTNPARPWLRLLTHHPHLNRNRRVRAWLEEVTRVHLDTYAMSNTYHALSWVALNLGCYGTACAFIEEHPTDTLRIHPMAIGSYCLATDENHVVNSVYRETTMTVEQLVRRFGLENCSSHIQTMWSRGHYDGWVHVLHVIEPNDWVVHGNMDHTGKPFRSVWLEYGGTTDYTTGSVDTSESAFDRLLGVKGFDEFPCLAPRWELGEVDDVYGTAPAMDALGDANSLQNLEKRRALALEKIVDPAMNAPASLRADGVGLVPGYANYIPDGSRQKLEPAHLIDSRALLLKDELERFETRINAAMFSDLFLALTMHTGAVKTAREIQERHSEKVVQLVTIIERMHDELHDPLVDRTFSILFRQGKIPPPPPELEGLDLRPEYVSMLGAELKLLQTGSIERLVGMVGGMTEVWPDAGDKINVDKVIDNYSELLMVEPTLLRDDTEVGQLRAQRKQEQMMSAEGAGMARDAAAAAQSLAGAQPAPDNMLGQLGSALRGEGEEEVA